MIQLLALSKLDGSVIITGQEFEKMAQCKQFLVDNAALIESFVNINFVCAPSNVSGSIGKGAAILLGL